MAVFHLCRICLTEDTNSGNMQPLFDKNNSHCAILVQKIEECGGIVLKPHDEFPKMICDQCLSSLDTSYKFRAMCQASEHALLDAIVKSELKVESHDHGSNAADIEANKSHIFFDLHAEIINAEEVDIDMLEKNEFHSEDSTHSYEEVHNNPISDRTDSESDKEFKRVETQVKIESKTICNNKKKITASKARGRPRLNPIVVALANIKTEIKPGRGRKKQEEIQDQIMCEICGNIYPKRSLLNMHMRRHMSEKPFDCEFCDKKFACTSEVRRHMRVHTGEKPFVCKFCGRTFADRSSNIKHERIHTKERPFSCNTCGKAFTYSNVLKNHILTHTGEKPFSCTPCNKTFSRKHQLDQHCATLTHNHTIKSIATAATEISDIIMSQSQNNTAFIENNTTLEHKHIIKNIAETDITENDMMMLQSQNSANPMNCIPTQ